MQYRRLGRTGLKVSEICFGTMTFGMPNWGMDEARSEEVFNTAIDGGINFYDTANSYAGGQSETILGRLIQERRSKLVIATKVFNPIGTDINDSGTSRSHIMRSIEESLKRLQTDYIDLYQIHHVDSETPTEERLRALDDLVHQGKVRYIGCSNEYAWRLCDALWLSEVKNLCRYESVQPQYNLLTRDIEDEILPLCREKHLGVIAWGPLAGGYLSGKYVSNRSPAEDSRFSDLDVQKQFAASQNVRILTTLREVGDHLGKSMAQVALRWVLDQEGLTSVIVGSTKVGQLIDNLGCSAWTIPSELIKNLNDASQPPLRYPHSMEIGMRKRRTDAVRMPRCHKGC